MSIDANTAAPATTSEGRTRWTTLRGSWSLPEVRWATAATVLFVGGLAVEVPGGPAWLSWGLFLGCYAAGGWEPGWAGLRALTERRLDVDLLMVVAAIGAAAIGQVVDGALLIVIFATSGALEAVATKRTEDSVRGLLDLAPEQANRLHADGEEVVRAGELVVGDEIRVRPGERIAADGKVVAGASEVDQATITGEPLPVDKVPGAEVFAGTVNGTGVLTVRVDRPAAESVVARIATLVEEATRTKAKTQLFVEKIEHHYSVGMVVATLLLFAVPILLGEPFEPTLLRAMTFMIVASPCAVVLATMPPLLAAIANAGRHGVLVKSAVVMERLGSTTQIALDKTGTLTRGQPRIDRIMLLPGGGWTENEVLRLAASAEFASEHPIAAAIVGAARGRGLTLSLAESFQAVVGHGVTACVSGLLVEVGSKPNLPEAEAVAAEGATAVAVSIDGRPVAVLGIVDEVRPEAQRAVHALTELTGRPPILVTGDTAMAARRVAAAVGIHDMRAGLLPDGKVASVRELETAGAKVAMVGDGINDAPALATAHTGLAMGGIGADLTLRTADAVVVRDDLIAIPAVIALARRARRVVAANLVIAATFIAVLAAWDLLGHLPLPLGVAGHEGSTVIVGLNGLRLLRSVVWKQAAG